MVIIGHNPVAKMRLAMLTFTDVNAARAQALFANACGNKPLLQAAIAYLERHWEDNASAMRFYTFLEKTAGI